MPGSWRKRGKSSYQLEVCIGTNYNGKPNKYTKTVRCKSDKQAEKELSLFYAECETGNLRKSSAYTVEALTDLFLKNLEPRINKGISAATYVKYRSNIKTHINPIIGKNKLSKLSPIHVDQWINYLLEYKKPCKAGKDQKGLSGKTITDMYFLLKLILDYAIKIELIEKNPCDKSEPPKYEKEEADFYNFDEINVMLDKLLNLDDNYTAHKAYIFLDLFTGLRGAELDGLEWNNIDFNTSTLNVTQNRRYVHAFGIVKGSTKTEKSKRSMIIPNICLDMLKGLKLSQEENKKQLGNKWTDSGYVFVNLYGKPYHPRSIAKWFPDFLTDNGLRRITLHKLRHTHVSLLNYLDVNEEEISRRVGHADSNITRRTYMHLFKNNNQEIANKLDNFFESFSKKNGGN